MTDELLITNARIVNEGAVFEGDLRVRDGRIDTVASGLSAGARSRVIDAAGAWLLPFPAVNANHFHSVPASGLAAGGGSVGAAVGSAGASVGTTGGRVAVGGGGTSVAAGSGVAVGSS